MASVYVTPAEARSKVKVVSAQRTKPKNLELVLANDGQAHRLLHLKKLQIFSAKKPVLELTQAKELDSENILANSTRKFVLVLPKDIPDKEISVDLDLEDSAD